MSDDSTFGDAVYQGQEFTPQIDNIDRLDSDDLLADPLDTGYSPPDREPQNTRFGTTEEEQLEGESLDQRLAEEEPDIDAGDDPAEDPDFDSGVADPRAGRLIAPDEGAHGDEESDQLAFDAGIDGGAASAEEAAMHVIGEEPALDT
ncbi:MAG: DUF5709 domain-containing protein [Actinomycetota bacterium]|nr:DUF5709 domain-containing protein [Actinomycetota bacterium]